MHRVSLILPECMLTGYKKKKLQLSFTDCLYRRKHSDNNQVIPFDICIKLLISFIVEIKSLQSTVH